eukprot:m.129518 g.129518  ORF g.129518 m.129518 type:complete len:806 (+) comp37982_c0_seq1:24-2441(+)
MSNDLSANLLLLDLLYDRSLISSKQYDHYVFLLPKQLLKTLRLEEKSLSTLPNRTSIEQSSGRRFRVHLYYPIVRKLSVSTEDVRRRALRSLSRVQGLTNGDEVDIVVTLLTCGQADKGAPCKHCLVVREYALLRLLLQMDSHLNEAFSEEKLRKGLAVASFLSKENTDAIAVIHHSTSNESQSHELILRVPGQVVLSILLAFSDFLKQMLFGMRLRTFLPPNTSLSFYLGSYPPIKFCLPTGVTVCNDTAAKETTSTNLTEIGNHLDSLQKHCRERSLSTPIAVRRVSALMDKLDDTEKSIRTTFNVIQEISTKVSVVQEKRESNILRMNLLRDQLQRNLDKARQRALLCRQNDIPIPAWWEARMTYTPLQLPIPFEFMGYVIAKGGRGLRKIEQLSGATIHVTGESEFWITSIEKSTNAVISAARSIRSKISKEKIRQKMIMRFSPPQYPVGAIITDKTPLYLELLPNAKFRLSATNEMPNNPSFRETGYNGLPFIQPFLTDFLQNLCQWKMFHSSVNRVKSDSWFQLQQVTFSKLGNFTRQEYEAEEAQQMIAQAKRANMNVSSGVRMNTFRSPARVKLPFYILDLYFRNRLGASHHSSLTRFDLTLSTPSCNNRRFTVYLRRNAGQFEFVTFPAGFDFIEIAGAGQLCTKNYSDFRIDLLFPDLLCDCRLFIRSAILDNSFQEQLEDRILIREFLEKLQFQGDALIPPDSLPEGCILEYQRKSKRTLYELENHLVWISWEQELDYGLQSKTDDEAVDKVNIYIRNMAIDELLKSEEWSPDTIQKELESSLKFVRRLIKRLK